MSVALAHLVGAAVLGVLGPYVLDRLPQRWSPRVLITAWVSSIATAVGLLILSALSALWPDPPPAGSGSAIRDFATSSCRKLLRARSGFDLQKLFGWPGFGFYLHKPRMACSI